MRQKKSSDGIGIKKKIGMLKLEDSFHLGWNG